jgi:uncharacterized protein YhbP (UPF0306 family)
MAACLVPMPIERSKRPVAARRIAALARELLDLSSLCAIATVTPTAQAHINTAYFASTGELELVWLSEPGATHSRNIRANGSASVAVYHSAQKWGGCDRGIQLFGAARELKRGADGDAERLYAARFPNYRRDEVGAYRFYVFQPRRLKLFDEAELGAGVFVTARVDPEHRLLWDRTEIYRPGADAIVVR